ncbi:unnamed protein product [Ilex paraguariensis]|uniref:Uncharacterized protein n=1 Tax=Ilex paraguariensis TaxID=185542 RepID=A0ABC8TUQ9_9AQUA
MTMCVTISRLTASIVHGLVWGWKINHSRAKSNSSATPVTFPSVKSSTFETVEKVMAGPDSFDYTASRMGRSTAALVGDMDP